MARQVLKRELLDVNPSVISALTLVNEDLSDAFEKVTMPTLIIWGQNDRVAPVRTLQMLLQHLPEARYAVVEGAAHVPMNEQPEKFNKLFYSFVDGDDAQVGLAADSGSDRELYKELSRVSECY
jgi:pimeloyl-ACP methyl ester carboxylesterase